MSGTQSSATTLMIGWDCSEAVASVGVLREHVDIDFISDSWDAVAWVVGLGLTWAANRLFLLARIPNRE